MRSVSVIGSGRTKFCEHWDASLGDMLGQACVNAINSTSLNSFEIDAIYCGCMASGAFTGQSNIGALVAQQLNLFGIPATRIEAACASGGVALRNALLSISSGEHDVVLVCGGEKMTDVGLSQASLILAGASDTEMELFHGATFPALFALIAKAHMDQYGTSEEQMASVAVKNHKNAMYNPYAHFHKEISVDDVMNSGYVASPLKLLDCSPISDGAAAIVLCSTEKAKNICSGAVEILASEQATDCLRLAERECLTELKATKVAARRAYEKNGILPRDIDVAEVHDGFTIAEILAIEDLQFFKKGYGGKAVENGDTCIDGEIAINTSGGLKANGHPVGATGISQVIEIFSQLRGEAGKRQVKKARIGLSHNVGGTGSTAVVTLFRIL